MRLNVLANIAELFEQLERPAETQREDRRSARGSAVRRRGPASAAPTTPPGLPQEALANERLLVRQQPRRDVGRPAADPRGRAFRGDRGAARARRPARRRRRAVFADGGGVRLAGLCERVAAAAAAQRGAQRSDDRPAELPRGQRDASSKASMRRARGTGRWRSGCLDIEGLDEINRANGYAVGDDCVGFVGPHAGRVDRAARDRSGASAAAPSCACFPGRRPKRRRSRRGSWSSASRNARPGHLPRDRADDRRRRISRRTPASADELTRYARLALFAAKREGRNHVVTARAGDELWVRDARAAFVRIVTEHEVPTASRGRQSPS